MCHPRRRPRVCCQFCYLLASSSSTRSSFLFLYFHSHSLNFLRYISWCESPVGFVGIPYSNIVQYLFCDRGYLSQCARAQSKCAPGKRRVPEETTWWTKGNDEIGATPERRSHNRILQLTIDTLIQQLRHQTFLSLVRHIEPQRIIIRAVSSRSQVSCTLPELSTFCAVTDTNPVSRNTCLLC